MDETRKVAIANATADVDRECQCEHLADQHGPDGCLARASSGALCACPGFLASSDAS